MRAAIRPGGWVAIEDLFTGSLRSEPPAPVLDRLQEVYCATVRAHGGDPTMLESGAATASELDELRSEVERAARDPERVFYQARIHQVWGRRPA